METPKKYEKMRKELEIISEKTRYKILLTLLASKEKLSFSQLNELLPSIPENNLNYHLNILKKAGMIEGKQQGYYIIYHITQEAQKFMEQEKERFIALKME